MIELLDDSVTVKVKRSTKRKLKHHKVDINQVVRDAMEKAASQFPDDLPKGK